MDEWVITLNNKIVRRFTISEGQLLTIGRGSDADIVVDNTAISRQHSSLELKGGVYYITDLYSLNGTRVNGERIEASVPVSKEDTIEIGKFRLQPAEAVEHQADYLESSSAPDLNDATIFIGSKKRQAGKGSPAPKDGPVLTAVAGEVSPGTLSLADRDSVKVGKDSSCDMVIKGFLIARLQFHIISRDGRFFLVPKSGWVKTRVNGIKVTGEHQLRKGDLIEAGRNRIRFD